MSTEAAVCEHPDHDDHDDECNPPESLRWRLDNWTYEELHRKYDDSFNEFIDEVHEEIMIVGLTYTPSRVLAEVDPIAYQQEFMGWLDGEADRDE